MTDLLSFGGEGGIELSKGPQQGFSQHAKVVSRDYHIDPRLGKKKLADLPSVPGAFLVLFLTHLLLRVFFNTSQITELSQLSTVPS